MIGRFFVVSGLILNVNPLRLVALILSVAFVASLILSVIVAMFPERVVTIMTDAFESAILTHGTLEEAEMLREIHQGKSR